MYVIFRDLRLCFNLIDLFIFSKIIVFLRLVLLLISIGIFGYEFIMYVNVYLKKIIIKSNIKVKVLNKRKIFCIIFKIYFKGIICVGIIKKNVLKVIMGNIIKSINFVGKE